ncbi:helix-turn-helix domain-containing protein [Paenirhodobacter populi]|nr:helix-turn-helix domain-containing protein [Sinirhodobacter populi]
MMPNGSRRGAGKSLGRGSARLRQVVNLMVGAIETPLPLGEIAGRAGISLSSLERLFQSELGMAPGPYYQMLRLSQVRELAASTGFDLRDIALRCGYSDAAALSKAFRRVYGHPIRKSRGLLPRRSGAAQGL